MNLSSGMIGHVLVLAATGKVAFSLLFDEYRALRQKAAEETAIVKTAGGKRGHFSDGGE